LSGGGTCEDQQAADSAQEDAAEVCFHGSEDTAFWVYPQMVETGYGYSLEDDLEAIHESAP